MFFAMEVTVFENMKALGGGSTDFLKTRVQLEVSGVVPQLIDFTVSQLHKLEKTREIIRFDCSHGFLNVHRFYRSKTDRTDYPEQKPSTALYEECKKDILQNWQKYREYFMAKWFLD